MHLSEKKEILKQRAGIIKRIRALFDDAGFLEVETPVRIPANAPEAYIDPVESEGWYLQTSPEIAMKRMLAAGFDKIYQVARCFRKGERGRLHLPEMTLLEWYETNADYTRLMAFCESFIPEVAVSVHGRPGLIYRNQTIDLTPPWPRLSLDDAFRQYADVSLADAMRTDSFEQVLSEQVEPNLGINRPVFITRYPAEMASLARKCPDNPLQAERTELYVAGIELANGFSELNDPAEQRDRFQVELKNRNRTGQGALPVPEPFLAELALMPPAAGMALGLDRLILLLLNYEEISQCVAFVSECM